jgi:hypothetical protein
MLLLILSSCEKIPNVQLSRSEGVSWGQKVEWGGCTSSYRCDRAFHVEIPTNRKRGFNSSLSSSFSLAPKIIFFSLFHCFPSWGTRRQHTEQLGGLPQWGEEDREKNECRESRNPRYRRRASFYRPLHDNQSPFDGKGKTKEKRLKRGCTPLSLGNRQAPIFSAISSSEGK